MSENGPFGAWSSAFEQAKSIEPGITTPMQNEVVSKSADAATVKQMIEALSHQVTQQDHTIDEISGRRGLAVMRFLEAQREITQLKMEESKVQAEKREVLKSVKQLRKMLEYREYRYEHDAPREVVMADIANIINQERV